MDFDQEEAAWDVVRDKINFDVESGEFAPFINEKIARSEDAEEQAEQSAPANEEQSEGTQLLDLDNQPGPSTAPKVIKTEKGLGRAAKKQTVESLIGQANLVHARGKRKEAMAYLFEAIKIDPYHVQTYKELSDIYAEQNEMEKSFEFRILASLMTDKTTAPEWDDTAELARDFGRLELAVACLAKAIKKEPGNWIYYEKRIQILDSTGDIELAMKTRLQAAQSVESSQINFAWIEKQIKTAADYFCNLKDEQKATEALETFIVRSREFGRPIELEHLALLGMWTGKGKFEESAKSIQALHQDRIRAVYEDGTPAVEIEFTNSGYLVEPFPPPDTIRWLIDARVPNMFIHYLIISLVHLGQFHLIDDLVQKLLERPASREEANVFLDISRALHAMQQPGLAINFLNQLRAAKAAEFEENADAWFLYGYFHQILDQTQAAREAYEHVLAIQPGHIDARINLSTILQQLGQSELALQTLKDLDLDSSACSQIPDERLLVRQAEVLLMQNKTDQYIGCLRMLLIPHFYMVHLMGEEITRAARRKSDKILHMSLKRCALDSIRGTPLERLVKRLGAISHLNQRPLDGLNPNELHDYAFKLSEALHLAGHHEEMLWVVCYAFLHPTIASLGTSQFTNLLIFASIKARQFALAFEFLRFHMTYTLPKTVKKPIESQRRKAQHGNEGSQQTEEQKRVYVAINFILCQHQSVNYHRFIMRQLVKQPDCDALHIISGNNSLVTGSYRHALGEYFAIWLKQKDNPQLAFLIALTFAHISCKKDISSRHMVALRSLAFMAKYAELRTSSLCQEVQYNMGRLFHQMGLLPNAITCYERVLYDCQTPLVWAEDQSGEKIAVPAERYDLKRQAAYNLSLIYESSGNRLLARDILEEFCTI